VIKLKDILSEGKLPLKTATKTHYLNLIKKEVESKKGQLAYAEDKIRYEGTPKWARKEWLGVAKDLKKDIKQLNIRVKQIMKLKEEKLNEVIQPKVGDSFEWDSWLKLGKIIKIDSKQIYVKPLKGTFGKAVDSVQFDIKKLKFRTSKDKPIWKPR
jgi:hypothetical protein